MPKDTNNDTMANFNLKDKLIINDVSSVVDLERIKLRPVLKTKPPLVQVPKRSKSTINHGGKSTTIT